MNKKINIYWVVQDLNLGETPENGHQKTDSKKRASEWARFLEPVSWKSFS